MPQKFSPAENAKLGYYVYLYTDPRTDEPFYVGKGKGNRVFAHLADRSETEKVARIREIGEAGLKPRLEILAYGLDEETAFKVEAAAIDLIGFDRLTNRVIGQGARRYGRQSIDSLHARLSSTPLVDIRHRVVLITIDKSIELIQATLGQRFDGESDESRMALYDGTRAAWRVQPGDGDRAELALAIHDDVVIEVYRIATWLPAGSTMDAGAPRNHDPNRYEFVGRIADGPARSHYRLKSVSHLTTRNPIRYLGPGRYPA
jgi:hypothetical protein